MLPTFLGIGAFKSGTTTLAALLDAHPQIHVDPEKEADFFSVERRWARGAAWYEARFAGAGAACAVGELSPSYAVYPTFPEVAERVASLLPEVRIIYLLRHPIDRMRSMYRHMVANGAENLPFVQALASRPEYLETSRYGMQLARWLEHLPREQILVATTDELRGDPAALCRRIHVHLGVDPEVEPPPRLHLHRTADRLARAGRPAPDTTMSHAAWSWVVGQLARDQELLDQLLGAAAPTWDLDDTSPPDLHVRRGRCDRSTPATTSEMSTTVPLGVLAGRWTSGRPLV